MTNEEMKEIQEGVIACLILHDNTWQEAYDTCKRHWNLMNTGVDHLTNAKIIMEAHVEELEAL